MRIFVHLAPTQTQSLHEDKIINAHIKLTSNLVILMLISIPSFRENSETLVVKKLLQKIIL